MNTTKLSSERTIEWVNAKNINHLNKIIENRKQMYDDIQCEVMDKCWNCNALTAVIHYIV